MGNSSFKPTILVTGANGQLGTELNIISAYKPYTFIFSDVDDLDLTDGARVNAFFNTRKIDFCINCAAYTAVDEAEKNVEAARVVNVDAVQNLAEACTINNTFLIHISTDFVFRGNSYQPLTESYKPDPISVYGFTKLEGENIALKSNDRSIIVRTSWLYSAYGKNFVKTMIRLGKEKDELGVVVDQIGTPTYAGDLAKAIVEIIKYAETDDLREKCGIYHFSNEGVASWYDFAKAIFEYKNLNVRLNPLLSEQFPMPAQRPFYSVLDKTKFKRTFNFRIPNWRDSLKSCLELLED
ncbi:MAG: dTDP-4-dehydrorhamnose reductase [Cytophagales bacterium]|nr:dTDP-4-dehydrorhamnose reductase [Cytophagales bacterium]